MSEAKFRNIIIDEVEVCEKYISQQSHIPIVRIKDVIDFVESEVNTIFYLKKDLTGCEERDAKFAFIDTGYIDVRKNHIFISCLSREGYFVGHRVGNLKILFDLAAEFYKIPGTLRNERLERFKSKYDRKTEKRTRVLNDLDITQDVRTSEMIKTIFEENDSSEEIILKGRQEEQRKKFFASDTLDVSREVEAILLFNKWHSTDGLDRYIKVLGKRIMQLVEAKKSQYFELNNIRSALINTGLLNQFGDDIYMIYRHNLGYGMYMPHKLIARKSDCLDDGFTLEQSQKALKPITFFDDDYKPLSCTIEEFDINNMDLNHIIEERRDRFPEELRSVTPLVLAMKLRQSLELGLKLQQRDKNFAKPVYSSQDGLISWLLPMYISDTFVGDPELVMLINKRETFYHVKTILPYDDEVKDKIHDLSIYGDLW